MAKYIIDIEDVPFGRNDDPFIPHGMDELYRAKGFKSLVFDQNGLDKLTPYTEPDQKAIEDEVWEFAWEVLQLDLPVFTEIFGYDTDKMDYRDYKYKYEAWKKKKDQIRVGDEVEYFCGGNIRFVVCGIDNGVAYGFKYQPDFKEFDIGEYCKIDELKKTGRHFDEIEELLKKIGEE